MKRIVAAFVVACVYACVFAFSLPINAETASVIEYLEYSKNLPELGVSGQLEVHLINVGSQDCILLRCDGQDMLVDSGVLETHERVLKYFKTIHVDRLDYAFATHPHIDHIGGFVGLMGKIPIQTLLYPPLFDGYESYIQTKLFAAVEKNAIPMRIVENNAVMTLGSAVLTFMQWQNLSASINDRSMVIKVQYGERTILLAADLENAGQSAMLAEYGDFLRADILKMPHHGLTSYTKDVNATVNPSLGISTNGLNITDTLKAYRKYGVKPIITVKGTVVAVTNGSMWYVWQIPNKK
ncbi:MBL fold hydrolase [Clostridia bacterium]|nr:MBL fold hydrolase [Clostridia bacterium]